MQKTIYVMPNPYGVLDAHGLLAGGCQMVGAMGSNGLPPCVGAELRMVEGSYNDRQAEISEAAANGKMVNTIIPPIYSRSERRWAFTAVEPVAIKVSVADESFYVSRARRNGTPPCALLCSGPDDLQLEQLASERLDAIARYKAERGLDAPVAEWAKQWELDETVAAVSVVLAEKLKTDAEKADSDAKKSADDRANAAKGADDKRKAAREKAVAEAKERLGAKPAAKVSAAKPSVGADVKNAPSEK